MLFDTTFFIDLGTEISERHPDACHALVRRYRHVAKRVSVVTLGEFAVGAPVAYTLKFFRGYQPVALGTATALSAGRLQASLNFAMGENDLWIAATALRFGWPLVSRDKAFARVPGLKVIGY